MTILTIEERIRQFVAENMLFSGSGFALPDSASFLENGIADSTSVLELIMFVEDDFGLAVDDEEIVPDNFDSVAGLAAYIRNKTARQPCVAPRG
jgi:acyl carrier protein